MADLLDGDFEANDLDDDSTITNITDLDQGWRGVVTGNPAVVGLAGTTDDYAKMVTAYWTNDGHALVGQSWTEAGGLGDADKVEFDVVFDSYTAEQGTAKMRVEIFGIVTKPGTWRTISLTKTTYDKDDGTGFASLILSEEVDISAGIAANYSTAAYDLTGYTMYAIRLTPIDPGASTPFNNLIGIDNVEIVPEPATMALLGLGGIGMLIRRKR